MGATEPLVYSRMQLATGRNLDIITEATLKHPFSGLRSSTQNIENGLYLAELTDSLLDERQSAPELFDLLLSSLYLLENRPEESLVLRRFELQALALAGYAPETRRCVVCRALRPDERSAVFSPALGGIVCSRCRGGQDDLMPARAQVLQAMERILSLPAHEIGSVSVPRRDNQDLGRLIRAHIARHVERELKSSPQA